MEDNKKTRGLGKGLSELLGEARAKAATSKQIKTEPSHIDNNNSQETLHNLKHKDNDLDTELDDLNNILDTIDDFNNTKQKNIQPTNTITPANEAIIIPSHNPSPSDEDDAFETIIPEDFLKLPLETHQKLLEKMEAIEREVDEEMPWLPKKVNGVFPPLHKEKEEEPAIETVVQTQDNNEKPKDIENSQKNEIEHIDDIKTLTTSSPVAVQNQKDVIHHLPIELVNPHKEQPRKFFDTNDLNDLASSIKIYGVIQPILVKQKEGEYIIVAGERRWRASQIAGLKTIPAIIVTYTEDEILEVALIENIQRANLTPIDEAKAYYYLIHKYELTQNELAQKVGKSRSYIANMVRLLDLDDNVKNYLETGELSIGHARVLVGVKNAADLAEKIIKSHMSVRKVEELISQLSEKQNVRLPKAFITGKNTDILALEADLKAALGVHVVINTQSAQKGNLIIRYESLDQLDEVCRRLCSTWGADVA